MLKKKTPNPHLQSVCRSADIKKMLFLQQSIKSGLYNVSLLILTSEFAHKDNSSIETALSPIFSISYFSYRHISMCVCVSVCLYATRRCFEFIHFPIIYISLLQSFQQLGINFPLFPSLHKLSSPPFPAHLPGYTKPIYYDCITINDFITSACQ